MNWYEEKHRIITKFFSGLKSSDQDEWLYYRKLFKTDLFAFIKVMGQFSPKSGGDIDPVIHKPICDFWIDRKIKRKVVYMPRSWRKSTMLTQWGNLWEYLHNNEIRILIPTEKEEKATEWIRWIEGQVVRNARLRWQYPELTFITDSYRRTHSWSGKRCLLPRQGVYPEATISCIGIRGGAQGGHYDLIGGDDLIGEKGFESPLVILDAIRWFSNITGLLVNPNVEDENGSVIRLTGTFWGLGDMGCHILDEYKEYKWMVVPLLKDSSLEEKNPYPGQITWIQNPNAADGESNWETGMTTEEARKMEMNPPEQIKFWTQYMNQPWRASALSKFDKHWIKYYKFEDRPAGRYIVCQDDGQAFKLSDIALYGMVDPGGFSEKKPGKDQSQNAILIGGQPYNSNKKFVLYAWAGRFKNPDSLWKELVRAHEEFHPRIWEVEIFAQQAYILRDFQERAKKEGRAIRIVAMPADTRANAKELNIQALIPVMSNGEIYLHESMRGLIAEIISYPMGITKDQLDMLAKLNQYHFTRQKKEGPAVSHAERLAVQRPYGTTPGY